jgi:hypothetical protein
MNMLNQNGVEVFRLDTNKVYNQMYYSKWNPQVLPTLTYYPDELFAESPYFPDYYIGNFGTIIRKNDGTLVHQRLAMEYMSVDIQMKSSLDDVSTSNKTIFVHRVVMMTHCPIPNYNDMTVNHINGVRNMNIYAPGTPWNNLEWVSNADNIRHAFREGLNSTVSDPRYITSTMSDEMVHKICQMFVSGMTVDQVLDAIGFPHTHLVKTKMYQIRTQKVRREITTLYDMHYESPRYTEREVEAICQILQEIKRRKISFTAILVIAVLDKYYGITGVDRNYIISLRRRDEYIYNQWKHIIDKYDF